MFQKAVDLEAIEFLGRDHYQRGADCLLRGYRNGYVDKRVRTTNLLERLFGEGQRRSKVVPRFMNERSGLSLMFAVLVDASAAWRGVKITCDQGPGPPTGAFNSGLDR